MISSSFAARLPKHCDGISRKLGGPVIIASPKRERARPSMKKPEARPGAATKRPASSLKPRTIERALKKEQSRRSLSRGPANTIALLRSATSTVIPGLKRENSDSLHSRDTGSVGRASVDPPKLLSSGSNLAKEEAKAQKKAMVDAQLRDAINVLRRPNREQAGKSIMEAAEKRGSGGLSHTRSAYHPDPDQTLCADQLPATQKPRSRPGTLCSNRSRSRPPPCTTASATPWPMILMMIPSSLRRASPSFQGPFEGAAPRTSSAHYHPLQSGRRPRREQWPRGRIMTTNQPFPHRHPS
jgi:DNA replication regulator SLD3